MSDANPTWGGGTAQRTMWLIGAVLVFGALLGVLILLVPFMLAPAVLVAPPPVPVFAFVLPVVVPDASPLLVVFVEVPITLFAPLFTGWAPRILAEGVGPTVCARARV